MGAIECVGGLIAGPAPGTSSLCQLSHTNARDQSKRGWREVEPLDLSHPL